MNREYSKEYRAFLHEPEDAARIQHLARLNIRERDGIITEEERTEQAQLRVWYYIYRDTIDTRFGLKKETVEHEGAKE